MRKRPAIHFTGITVSARRRTAATLPAFPLQVAFAKQSSDHIASLNIRPDAVNQGGKAVQDITCVGASVIRHIGRQSAFGHANVINLNLIGNL